MTKLDEFIKILNDKIDEFIIIKANQNAKAPALPYATVFSLPSNPDMNKYVSRYKEIKPDGWWIRENISRRVESTLQFDVYSKDREQANTYCMLLFEHIMTISRIDINLAGFGALESRAVSIDDRTYLEHDSNLFRFGFDVTIDYMTQVERYFQNVETVKIKDEETGETTTVVNPNN